MELEVVCWVRQAAGVNMRTRVSAEPRSRYPKGPSLEISPVAGPLLALNRKATGDVEP